MYIKLPFIVPALLNDALVCFQSLLTLIDQYVIKAEMEYTINNDVFISE